MEKYRDYCTAWADGATVTLYDEIREEPYLVVDFSSEDEARDWMQKWEAKAPADVIAEIIG